MVTVRDINLLAIRYPGVRVVTTLYSYPNADQLEIIVFNDPRCDGKHYTRPVLTYHAYTLDSSLLHSINFCGWMSALERS